MSELLPQCANLQDHVDRVIELLHKESSLRQQDISGVQASLKKAISPKFEIVFAGAFSAGKSMLINALLERELLYSAEGHATGTECYIEYADADKECVVLTFLSEAEIREQVSALCQLLGINANVDINHSEALELLQTGCNTIIQVEGGENKSDKGKQAKALLLLLEGFVANRDRIQTFQNSTYSMEQFNFTNLKEAASYARRGSNSAVLKRVEYYCHHPLLKDGNVIIDTPGIDAPVKRDAELTYQKIEHPDTSAVICVLKAASSGEMTTEETELMEKMKTNPGIRDRVFYTFNRIDETWYNSQLRQRLESLLNSDFRDTNRIYKTSGLLGFYGGLIKSTSGRDRFGLDTIFAQSVTASYQGNENLSFNPSYPDRANEETPQFVYAFNNYCGISGKLPSKFRISINGYETPNQNYVRILADWGTPLINQLIQDSGIEDFRNGITRYLTEEKKPQLFKNLANDLSDLCIQLRTYYQGIKRDLDSQPREVEAMKSQELQRLNQELQQVGQDFLNQITEEVNNIVTNQCETFENDFRQLQSRMIRRLDELLDGFSVEDAYRRSTISHPRNSTAPLLAVLVEALYYLANQLEDILVDSIKETIPSLFQWLISRVRTSDYYRQLYRLLGNDSGIEQELKRLEKEVTVALINAAKIECDRFVRESPRFYDEGTFSIYQFRQTLQQTSSSYDCESMVEAQPAIRQLLKLDFEPKLSVMIRHTFRQTVNQTLKSNLLPMAADHADEILQQYDQARGYLEQNLEKEAEEKLERNRRLQGEVEQKIDVYNESVNAINRCLESMQLYEFVLPVIAQADSVSDVSQSLS